MRVRILTNTRMRFLVLRKCYVNDKLYKPDDVLTRKEPLAPGEENTLRPLDPLPRAEAPKALAQLPVEQPPVEQPPVEQPPVEVSDSEILS